MHIFDNTNTLVLKRGKSVGFNFKLPGNHHISCTRRIIQRNEPVKFAIQRNEFIIQRNELLKFIIHSSIIRHDLFLFPIHLLLTRELKSVD